MGKEGRQWEGGSYRRIGRGVLEFQKLQALVDWKGPQVVVVCTYAHKYESFSDRLYLLLAWQIMGLISRMAIPRLMVSWLSRNQLVGFA